MVVRIAGSLIVATLLACATLGPGNAQSLFERLVMPGDVIEGHKKLEKDCSNCHESFSKKSQRRLCLTCHKDVAADIKKGAGFHGKSKGVGKTECKHCHTDHIGRKADIVQFDSETFDHRITDYQLKGRHQTVRCENCHIPKKKFRDASSRCFDCHKQDDPHKARLGEACENCHNESDWKKTTKFDHDKTKFPLVDAHKKVDCKACHTGERYKGISTACVDCHRINDSHEGRFGDKCKTCHKSTKWGAVRFDHGKQTSWPLIGKHAKAKCYACHTGDLYRQELSSSCASCHTKDDPHKGQLGKNCNDCHRSTGWREKVVFDHDIVRFPLIGLHAVVPCEECHLTQTFKDAPLRCVECHKKDRYHDGRLGTACADCHNPSGWPLWEFDHNKQTEYPLTGAHAGLDCHACHKTKNAKKIELKTNCYACHKADDTHRGSFGPDCARCHSTSSWIDVSIQRQ